MHLIMKPSLITLKARAKRCFQLQACLSLLQVPPTCDGEAAQRPIEKTLAASWASTNTSTTMKEFVLPKDQDGDRGT